MTINTPNLNIPKLTDSDNFNTTTLGNIVDAIDQNAANAQTLETHTSDNLSHVPYAVATGVANNYAVTLNPAPASYVDGMAVAVKINLQNTSASTINLNGLGAKTIKKANGNDVSSGNLKANAIYTLRYNGTNFILQGEGASGNATASDLLSGKTASTDAGDIVGTLPNNGSVTITPGSVNKPIPAGYHNGSGTVLGDVDLKAENIKKDVNIFGIVGSYDAKQVRMGSLTATSETLIVSGLGFRPKIIIVYGYNIVGGNNRHYRQTYLDPSLGRAGYETQHNIVNNLVPYAFGTANGALSQTPMTVNDDGFQATIFIDGSTPYYWIAIE